MEKDVLIFLNSSQSGGAVEDDKIEVITAGSYYFKNGKHYIVYNELADNGNWSEQNIIKISEASVEIIRKGEASVHMVFNENKKTFSYYDVPYGKLFVELETRRIQVEEEADRLTLLLEYRLEVENQHVADCLVEIRVESKSTCRIDLAG